MKRALIILALATAPTVVGLSQEVPLTLRECRQQAVANNESLQKADIAARQAELDKRVAFASYLPQLDGSAIALFLKDTDLLSDVELQMRGTYLAELSLTQPIFAGGRILYSNKLAKVGQEVAQLQKAKTEQEIIASADAAYYTLVAVRQKVRMLEAYSRQMEGLYDQVKTSVDAELATRNDLLRVSAKQSEVEYQLRKARNGAEICRLALCNAMGTDFDTAYVPVDTVFTEGSMRDYSLVPDVDISARPEVALMEQNVKAYEYKAKIQRGNLLPTVGISLSYGHFDRLKVKGQLTALNGNVAIPVSYTINGTNPMGILSISIPIWHWGTESNKLRRARYDIETARLDQQQNTRLLTIEARNAAQNLSDSQNMLETAIIGQEQADENLRIMRLRFEASLSSLTDLLDAQSQWAQAHSNLIEAQTQLRMNESEYLRTIGKLSL